MTSILDHAWCIIPNQDATTLSLFIYLSVLKVSSDSYPVITILSVVNSCWHSSKVSAPLQPDHKSKPPVPHELSNNAGSEQQLCCTTGDASQFSSRAMTPTRSTPDRVNIPLEFMPVRYLRGVTPLHCNPGSACDTWTTNAFNVDRKLISFDLAFPLSDFDVDLKIILTFKEILAKTK